MFFAVLLSPPGLHTPNRTSDRRRLRPVRGPMGSGQVLVTHLDRSRRTVALLRAMRLEAVVAHRQNGNSRANEEEKGSGREVACHAWLALDLDLDTKLCQEVVVVVFGAPFVSQTDKENAATNCQEKVEDGSHDEESLVGLRVPQECEGKAKEKQQVAENSSNDAKGFSCLERGIIERIIVLVIVDVLADI